MSALDYDESYQENDIYQVINTFAIVNSEIYSIYKRLNECYKKTGTITQMRQDLSLFLYQWQSLTSFNLY